jgi:hypothetical protein
MVEPTDLELIRKIAAAGGRKYTAGTLDRRKYQRLVVLGWLTEASVNVSDVLYEVTAAGKAAALETTEIERRLLPRRGRAHASIRARRKDASEAAPRAMISVSPPAHRPFFAFS